MGSDMFSLAGKKALVTGGSRGIGLGIATGMVESGADVAIAAREKGRLEEAKRGIEKKSGKKVWTFCIDLEETEKIGGVYEKIISETGGIDVLVNCAGITGRAKAEKIDSATWEKVMKINLEAALVMSQAFFRERSEAGKGGKIINIGSLMCHGARPTTAAYASSKGGLLMLTKSLAVEWAKYNINVNAIGPGFIATDLTAPLQADGDFDRWVTSSAPLGRWGRPEDIAGAAVFLASSASDYVTGEILYVDGGWLAAL